MRTREIRRRGRCWTVERLPADAWREMDADAGRRMAAHWPSFGTDTVPHDSEPGRRRPVERGVTRTDPGEHNRAMRTRARNARRNRCHR